jgi:hypothetical protein
MPPASGLVGQAEADGEEGLLSPEALVITGIISAFAPPSALTAVTHYRLLGAVQPGFISAPIRAGHRGSVP